jgi:formate dehydrogenase maturation protein FdhE
MVAELAVAISGGVVVVVVAAYLAWARRSNRRAGAEGFVREVRLACPKCHGAFDYAFVPGASATSLRLGTGRYMACPLCRRWSVFRLAGAPLTEPSPPGNPPPATP